MLLDKYRISWTSVIILCPIVLLHCPVQPNLQKRTKFRNFIMLKTNIFCILNINTFHYVFSRQAEAILTCMSFKQRPCILTKYARQLMHYSNKSSNTNFWQTLANLNFQPFCWLIKRNFYYCYDLANCCKQNEHFLFLKRICLNFNSFPLMISWEI